MELYNYFIGSNSVCPICNTRDAGQTFDAPVVDARYYKEGISKSIDSERMHVKCYYALLEIAEVGN